MATVRPVTRADLDLARRLRLAALADAPEAFAARLEDERAMSEAAWRRRVESNAAGVDTAGFFAVVDGRELGTVVGVYRGSGAELAGMWVAPEARGRGAGRVLVEAVCGWAAARGCARVGLSVRESNRAAIALYERCGFAFVPERPDYLPPYDTCERHMELQLSSSAFSR